MKWDIRDLVSTEFLDPELLNVKLVMTEQGYAELDSLSGSLLWIMAHSLLKSRWVIEGSLGPLCTLFFPLDDLGLGWAAHSKILPL